MFINLSNHPSEYWDSTQLESAHRYGEVVDLPFPCIEPQQSKEDILLLAEDYAQRILDIRTDEAVVVHVMGEMTFTYNVVRKLKDKGITCVASTTNRDTHYDEEGRKVSGFGFVMFREY